MAGGKFNRYSNNVFDMSAKFGMLLPHCCHSGGLGLPVSTLASGAHHQGSPPGLPLMKLNVNKAGDSTFHPTFLKTLPPVRLDISAPGRQLTCDCHKFTQSTDY